MAKKNEEKKSSSQEKEKHKAEIAYEQLHLFAAFQTVWQAPIR
jgi:hypothetical protein